MCSMIHELFQRHRVQLEGPQQRRLVGGFLVKIGWRISCDEENFTGSRTPREYLTNPELILLLDHKY